MADSESSTAPSAPSPATLGETLRVARLAQDLTIEQLSTELRIEAKQLQALENDRFEQIGVPVFVKGYLKQYGMRLGLDVRELLALYYKQTTLEDVQIQPNRTIKLRDEREITWVLAGIVLAVVVIGLAIWWWNGGRFAMAPSTSSPPAATRPAEDGGQPEQAEPRREAPTVTPREALPAVDPPATEPARPDAPPAEIPAVAAAGGADSADARAAPIVAVPLQFSFEGESWAEVTDARGERLLFGLNPAGRTVTVRGEPPFAILLGDANVVRLTVGGEPYEIPRAGRQGNLARFSVDIAEE
jgi:cytoskeleton protein RodZ